MGGEDLHETGSEGGEKVVFAEVGLEIWGWEPLRSPWQSWEVCEERVLGVFGVRVRRASEDLRMKVGVMVGVVPASWLLTGPTGGYMCVSLRLPMDLGG